MPAISSVRRFLSRRDGNVAVIFALSSLPLLAFTGAAIDYGLATRLQTKLQGATDATALLLCQTSVDTQQSALQTMAATSMGGYMAPAAPVVDALGYVPAGTGVARQITINTHIASRTFFPAFTTVSAPRVSASSQCTTPLAKTFEIALVLDTTGSMSEQSNGTTKMAGVQQAANNFLTYVQNSPSFSSDTRISIVPFSSAVAVNPNDSNNYRKASWVDTQGKSIYHWTNIDKNNLPSGYKSRFDFFAALKAVNSAWDWAGCFETLPYPQDVQDGAPTADPNTLYVPLFAPDEPGTGNNNANPVQWGSSSYADWNSYLSDSTNASGCSDTTTSLSGQSATASATYLLAEKKPCKYVGSTTTYSRSTSSYYGFNLGMNGPNWACPSQPLQRLTNNYSTLTTLVNSLSPAGSTNIHEGLMWGWRTISPNSVFGDGASYSSTTVNKIIILMTDGMNDWLAPQNNNPNGSLYNALGYLNNADGTTASGRLPPGYQSPTTNLYNPYDTSSGSGRSAIDQLTKLACANANAAGISIYTIAFSVPSDPIDANGQTLLKNCATVPSQYYLENDSNGVVTAFAAIAKSIGSLRLSK